MSYNQHDNVTCITNNNQNNCQNNNHNKGYQPPDQQQNPTQQQNYEYPVQNHYEYPVQNDNNHPVQKVNLCDAENNQQIRIALGGRNNTVGNVFGGIIFICVFVFLVYFFIQY